MTFDDLTVNNNTTSISVNVSNQQALPNSNAARETNVVIGFDLQKMLQAMGLTMEQWHTMSTQEQMSAREIYAKNQQQNLLNEQAGMGIQGLSIEKTIDESSNEQLSDEVIEETHVHNNEEYSARETSDTHNNAFKWAFTLKENKRQYLIQKMKDSEQFKDKNLTDEDYENLLNEYITHKTKERFIEDEVPPRFLKIENEAWEALSLEEKTELVNSEWDKLDERRKERFEGKTLNDYAFFVELGISGEDYKNLSTLERLNLENLQREQELNEINIIRKEHVENHSHSEGEDCKVLEKMNNVMAKSEAILSEFLTLQEDATTISGEVQSNKNINDKYKNIVQGIEIKGNYVQNAENLKNGIDAATAHLQGEEKQKETSKIISAYLQSYKDKKDRENRALAVMQYINISSTDPNASLTLKDVLAILNDKEITAAICDTIEETNNEEILKQIGTTFDSALVNLENNAKNDVLGSAIGSLCFDGGLVNISKTVAKTAIEKGFNVVAKQTAGSKSRLLAGCYADVTKNITDEDVQLYAVGYLKEIKHTDIKVKAAEDVLVGKDGSYQLKLQEAMGNDKYILIGEINAAGNGYIEEEAQVQFAENVRVNSEKTDSAVEIQKGLIDAIATGFTAENQKNAYEDIITNTSYVEVQEHAASSIYKLDESIREWAEQFTKSLGIERVTNAIKTEPPAPSEKNTVTDVSSTSYTSKSPELIIQQDIVKDPVVNIIDKNAEETKEVNFDFTKSNDREKFVQYFMQNPIEMAKYLAKTSAKQKEIFITLLCNSSKETAIKLAEQSPSFALLILRSSQIKVNVQGAVANKILEKYPKGHEVYIAALEYNNKFAIGKPSKKNEEEKGFLIRA